MKHITLRNSTPIPCIGLGTWKLSNEEAENIVDKALNNGYRHIDCALIYQNEAAIGRVLKSHITSGSVKRKDLFITSKLWNTYHRPELVMEGCQKSLFDLELDYIDLYLMHWPVAYAPGRGVFPQDADGNLLYDDVDYIGTWKAMEELVGAGLVKAIGLSNFNQQQIERILQSSLIKPAMLQIECHLGFLNQNLIDFAQANGMRITAYAPLGSFGVHNDCVNLLQLPEVESISTKYGKTPAQILLRHLIQKGYCVIPKTSNLYRLMDNMNIFDFKLTPEDIELLESAAPQQRRIKPALMSKHADFPFKSDL